VPGDALGGVVIADLGHTIERLRALRTAVSSGPATKVYVDKGMAAVTLALGFDLLDADAWKNAGLDPKGPLGIFIGPNKNGQIVFRASNPEKAKTTAMAWYALGGTTEPFDCSAVGAFYRCGSPSWLLVDDASKSMWAHMEKNLTAEERGMEWLGYAPLDQGEFKKEIDAANGPIKSAHAGYYGMTMSPERLLVRGGARLEEAAKLLPYLQPRKGESLLGLAAGGMTAGRVTFSPDALWALGKPALVALGGDPLGMAQAFAGFDIEKDVINNLTGEIVAAGYRSDVTKGKDGRPRPYMDRLGSVGIVGMSNDERTRVVANRIGEMIGGAIGSFGSTAETMGVKLAYRSEGTDRKVHWFSADIDAEHQKLFGLSHVDMFVSTIPGAMLFGVGPTALEEVKKRVGNKPAALLDTLPLPEERALFEKSPFVFWGHIGESFSANVRMNGAATALGAIDAEAGKVALELVQLGQLLYDGVCAIEVSADRADFVYQLSFL